MLHHVYNNPLKASFALSFSSSALCTSEFALASMIVILLQLSTKRAISYEDLKTSTHTAFAKEKKLVREQRKYNYTRVSRTSITH
uniref:Serine/threonine-protein phosphatase 5 n=1 Tax=Arundo donax TaxID=35708 RepID=A0A0A9D098_ARUDO